MTSWLIMLTDIKVFFYSSEGVNSQHREPSEFIWPVIPQGVRIVPMMVAGRVEGEAESEGEGEGRTVYLIPSLNFSDTVMIQHPAQPHPSGCQGSGNG